MQTTYVYSYARWSTDEQSEGDSRRRQAKHGPEFVKKHSTPDHQFILVDAGLVDPGTSSFHLQNLDGGKLGHFLGEVKAKRIPLGSILLLENLDRFSRAEPIRATYELLGLLLEGMQVAVLTPSEKILFHGMDGVQVEITAAVNELIRGHNESGRKSFLQKQRWSAARETTLDNKPITRMVPAWIRVEGVYRKKGRVKFDKSKFVMIEERAAVVVRIFEAAAKGMGYTSIAQQLNKDGVPTMGKKETWTRPYIARILNSRAVLGEYQPGTRSGHKKTTPIGPPIKNYFGEGIVTEEQYAAAHNARAKRTFAKGRSDRPGIPNLFSKKVFLDGLTATYHKMSGYGYLVPLEALDGGGKAFVNMRYEPFEECMLYWIKEIKLNPTNTRTELEGLKARQEFVETQITTMKEVMKNKLLGTELLSTFTALVEERDQLATRVSEIQVVEIASQAVHTTRLIELLQNGQNTEDVRRQLKQQISVLIDRIDVRVDGYTPHQRRRQYHFEIKFVDGQVRRTCMETDCGKLKFLGLWTTDPVDGVANMQKMFAEYTGGKRGLLIEYFPD